MSGGSDCFEVAYISPRARILCEHTEGFPTVTQGLGVDYVNF